jgi:hypothetical protein
VELLLGCGSARDKRIVLPGKAQEWTELKTVDIEASHHPDVVWDLNVAPWPFGDGAFDEVHAYELLEHLGAQGDAHAFFGTFFEIWRVLKPGGVLCATVPGYNSVWAWGDPGHRRIISSESLVFLDQTEYTKQIGKTAMADYRSLWRGDFERIATRSRDGNFLFCLEAKKPARVG